MLNITLKVNDGYGDTVYAGDPVLLTVSITNPDGREDAQHNKMLDMEIADLKARHVNAEVSDEEYEQELAELESQRVEYEVGSLGDLAEPWPSLVEFVSEESGAALSWPLETLMSAPEEPILELMGDLSAHARYGLSPEKTAEIDEGVHRVKAVFGEDESNPVVVGVSRDEDPSPSEDKTVRLVGYFLAAGALARSLDLINGVLDGNPNSIDGLILKAKYHEVTGDFDEGIDTLMKAREEFFAQNPEYDENPRYIDSLITRMMMAREGDDEEEEDATVRT